MDKKLTKSDFLLELYRIVKDIGKEFCNIRKSLDIIADKVCELHTRTIAYVENSNEIERR